MTYDKKLPFSFGFVILVMCTVAIILLIIAAISLIFEIPYKTTDDFANWAAIIVEIGIAAFISGVVLLYDRKYKKQVTEQQEKMSQLLNEIKNQQNSISELVVKIEKIESKQNEVFEEQKQFAISQIKSNLIGAKNILTEIELRENAISVRNTSMYPNLERDMVILRRALKNSFKSNRYLLTTYPAFFNAILTKEIHEISSQGIGYCDPDDPTGIPQSLRNLKLEVENLLNKMPQDNDI